MSISKLIRLKNILFLSLMFSSPVFADKLDDSNKLFDWAALTYPQYFSPSGQETFTIGGYFARYYPDTENYLGTKNDRVYVLGKVFGGLQDVGTVVDFLNIINMAEGETPEEGLQIILELYQARNFETLVLERYAELYKANSENEIASVIAFFERRFSNEEKLNEVTSFFMVALEGSPEISNDYESQISETGEIAIFIVGDVTFTLYKMKTGLWDFHL